MTIFTYYNPIPGISMSDEIRLVTIWRHAWEQAGFTPLVLGQFDFEMSGQLDYLEAVKRLPSANPTGYDLACYLRWPAVWNHPTARADGFAIMADYDVFPYEGIQDLLGRGVVDVVAKKQEFFGFQKHVPALVMATPWAVTLLCQFFRECSEDPKLEVDTVKGKPHTSDMMLLLKYAQKYPDRVCLSEDVKLYKEDGWLTAPAVHYSNGTTTYAGITPRWKHIPHLRK